MIYLVNLDEYAVKMVVPGQVRSSYFETVGNFGIKHVPLSDHNLPAYFPKRARVMHLPGHLTHEPMSL